MPRPLCAAMRALVRKRAPRNAELVKRGVVMEETGLTGGAIRKAILRGDLTPYLSGYLILLDLHEVRRWMKRRAS